MRHMQNMFKMCLDEHENNYLDQRLVFFNQIIFIISIIFFRKVHILKKRKIKVDQQKRI